MVTHKEERVQRAPNFAIVDEVDSILIDEARTPLIISGRGDKSTDLYAIVDRFAKTLTSTTVVEMDDKVDQESINDTADYIIDEKAKTATITQRGVKKAEEAFRVENLMDSENMTLLHHINQAIEAKEGVKIKSESKTLGQYDRLFYALRYDLTSTCKSSSRSM